MPSRFLMYKRQSYGGVTTGIADLGSNVGSSASDLTSSLSRGQIVAIVVAIFVVAGLAIGTTWWCCVRSARKREMKREQEEREAIAQATSFQERQHPQTWQPSNTYPHLDERRGSDPNTIDEDWSREPLQIVNSREAHLQHQAYGVPVYAARAYMEEPLPQATQQQLLPPGQKSQTYTSAKTPL